MDQLDTFIQEIIEAKHLPGITDEAKTDIRAQMREDLLDMVNRALVEALPDDRFEAFSQLVENETITDDQVQNFIAESGVDVQKVTAKTMLAFRDLYLQGPEERVEA